MSCSNKGYPIPVYEAGSGACSGAEYNTTAFSSTYIYEPEPEVPAKSLHEWLSDLRQDGLVLTSFVFGLISGRPCTAERPTECASMYATRCAQ